MEILIKASQFFLSLSILIVLHELGHFIPARLFKTRVEKFYLFFDPWFSLFKRKIGGTEYGIGWVPLGGYVKISGMIDESMDKEQMKLPPQDWEFRAKPAWKRLIIMLGGVTMNVILAIFIYMFSLFIWGEEYLSNDNVKYGIACDSLAIAAGFKDGDKIIAVDGQKVDDFNKVLSHIVLDQAKTVEVERNGEKVTISLPSDLITALLKKPDFISPRFPFEVGQFTDASPAKAAGIMVGDKIIGINNVSTEYFHEFKAEIAKHKSDSAAVRVLRGTDSLALAVAIPETGLLGIYPQSLDKYFTFSKHEYSFFQSIPAGFDKACKTLDSYMKQLKLLFSPQVKASESLGGFISIGNIFPATWDWSAFWGLTAFLSIMLAVMNLLPIPALDGGHVMFLMYEIIFRRKPNEKFMEYAQIAGMVLLFGLLLFANGNDIFRLFKK